MTKYHVVQISDRDVAGWIVAGASYDGKMPTGLYLTTLVAMGVEAGRKLGAQARLEPLDDGLHDVARSAARELMGTGLVGITDNLFRLQSFLDRYPARGIAEQHNPSALPDDVRALVIAARELLQETLPSDRRNDEVEALDKAVDAFSSRVPYENEPEALGGEDRFVGDGHRPGTFRQVEEGETAAANSVTLWLRPKDLTTIVTNPDPDGQYGALVRKKRSDEDGYVVPLVWAQLAEKA